MCPGPEGDQHAARPSALISIATDLVKRVMDLRKRFGGNFSLLDRGEIKLHFSTTLSGIS